MKQFLIEILVEDFKILWQFVKWVLIATGAFAWLLIISTLFY